MTYTEKNLADINYSFFLGLRYDLIVSSYFLAPSFLAWLLQCFIPLRIFAVLSTLILKVSFLIFSFVGLIIVISDLSFYSFFQDHINILFFGLFEDDTQAIIESIWKDYPVGWAMAGLVLYGGFVLYLSYRWIPFRRLDQSLVWKQKIPLAIVCLILFIGALRGGYGVMVLSPKYSDFSEVEFINQLSRNGVIALEKTYRLRQSRTNINFNMADQMGYTKRIQDAFSDYLGIDVSYSAEKDLLGILKRRTPKNDLLDKHKPHVIVIIMESFSSGWLDYHSESFNLLGDLEAKLKEAYYFPYILPSDNGTIGSLMTLTTNIPHRRGTRFLSESRYMNLPLETASHLPFEKRGYESKFFYGGKLSWRDIGRYMRVQGYDLVEGENGIKKDLPTEEKVGNEWGLFDEYLFNSIFSKIKESKAPQFIMALTTSNHPPFEVPENYQAQPVQIPPKLKVRVDREEKLFIERFIAYQYANHQLAKFVEKIQTSEFGENTIIAVTGDHNFFGFMNYEKSEAYIKHMVPAIFFIPPQYFSQKIETIKVGSHNDIMTTLYNLSLSDTEYLTFGEDLLREEKPTAINSVVLANKEGIHYKNRYYEWDHFPKVKTKPTEQKFSRLEKRYRSTITVADYYLRQTLEKSKREKLADEDKNQPQ